MENCVEMDISHLSEEIFASTRGAEQEVSLELLEWLNNSSNQKVKK